GVRPRAWPSAADTRYPDVAQDLLQHRTVVALPTGDHDHQWETTAVDSVMDLRRQPAAGTADAVTVRLDLIKRQILVIRRSPLCPGRAGSCSSRADAHARSSRPPTRPSRQAPPRQHRPAAPEAPDPTCRRPRSGGAASTPSAMARTRYVARPARAPRSGTGR